MRKFYHLFPTCPNCHEPHVNGAPLEIIDDNNLKCFSCNNLFHQSVDLISAKKFEMTIEAIVKNERVFAKKYLSKLPLVWEIILNKIETEYIEWINKIGSGKYLITWPWAEVKFLPILISEYLISNPEKKVIVIGDITDDTTTNSEIKSPNINEIFNYLIYLEDPSLTIDENLKKEMKKFDKKLVLEKNDIFHYEIRQIGADYQEDGNFTENSYLKCRNKLKKHIETIFGMNRIRKLKIRKNQDSGKENETLLNDHGDIDAVLVKRKQWIGELHYKSEWLWTILLNSQKIHRTKKLFPFLILKEDGKNEIQLNNENLIFISSSFNPSNIFNFITKIEPDLLLIQNTDEFIKDSLYKGEKSQALFSFLKNYDKKIVLMFSTSPDIRHLYGINYQCGYMKWNSILNCNIIPHTWDSEIIIKSITEKWIEEESTYRNPCSSRWDELLSSEQTPETDYIEIENLDDLDIFLEKVLKILSEEEIRADIIQYINDLKRTPLYIKGDYKNLEIFKRKGTVLDVIHYSYLMSSLHQRLENDNEFNEITKIIDNLYSIRSSKIKNPILEKIRENMDALLKNKQSQVFIIVDYRDVKGTEKLLQGIYSDEDILQRIFICSWKDLNKIQFKKTDKIEQYAISTIYPSLNYHIHMSPIKKFIFIGSRNNIKKIEFIIKKRLTETFSKPLFLLSEKENAPNLLKAILKNLDIPSNEALKNLTKEIFAEFQEYFDKGISIYDAIERSYSTINTGQRVILVVDRNNAGMFIPFETFLLIIEDNKPTEIKLNMRSESNLQNDLINKDILLNKGGIYISFKSIFTKFMLNYGEKIIFTNGPYNWNGFQDLFNNSIEWISILKKAIELSSHKNKVSLDDAEKNFLEFLSNFDLNAKDPNYLKGWWSNYESIITPYGIFCLYDVEHPKSIEDIQIIYKEVNRLFPELKVNLKDADKTYIASITIQNMRRSLLKGKIKRNFPTLQNIYILIQKEIKKLVENSPIFTVNMVNSVIISKAVVPYKIYENYSEYINVSS